MLWTCEAIVDASRRHDRKRYIDALASGPGLSLRLPAAFQRLD
jgi:hypothetical protein